LEIIGTFEKAVIGEPLVSCLADILQGVGANLSLGIGAVVKEYWSLIRHGH